VLTSSVNLKSLVNNTVDVDLAMREDEPSLLHAESTRAGPKRLHGGDRICKSPFHSTLRIDKD